MTEKVTAPNRTLPFNCATEARVTEARLEREILDALDGTEEVRVETTRDASSPKHETVIWVVVVDGNAFVRSVRGEKGRWFREASVNPYVTLRVNDRRVPPPALPGTDARALGEDSGG